MSGKVKLSTKINNKLDSFYNTHNLLTTYREEYESLTITLMFGSTIVNLFVCILNLVYTIIYRSVYYSTLFYYYLFLFIIRVIFLVSTYKNIKKNYHTLNQFQKKKFNLRIWLGFFSIILAILLGALNYIILKMDLPVIKTLVPAITIATYTFFKLFIAIRNIIKARKIDISLLTFRDIGLIDAITSIMVLESTMIYALDSLDERMHTLISYSGLVASLLIFFLCIYMVIDGFLKRKALKTNLS